MPFGRQRIIGIVTELHDRAPRVAAKNVLQFPDELSAPALTPELLRLGKWISDYYLAPLGEVFRTMLPLEWEFRKSVVYRITDDGHLALHLAGSTGSSSRSKKRLRTSTQNFAFWNTCSVGKAREETLKSVARTSRSVIEGMLRKKWVTREDTSQPVNAARTQKVAVLRNIDSKLNSNQKPIRRDNCGCRRTGSRQ